MKKGILLLIVLAAIVAFALDGGAAPDPSSELYPGGGEWAGLIREADELFLAGRCDQAMAVAREARGVAENAFGSDHPSVAICLDRMALVRGAQQDFAEAERLHRRALAIIENSYGPDHALAAISLDHLGLLYADQKRFALAEPLLEQAVAILEDANALYRSQLAKVLNDLADVYEAGEGFEEAELLRRRSARILHEVYGAERPRGTCLP